MYSAADEGQYWKAPVSMGFTASSLFPENRARRNLPLRSNPSRVRPQMSRGKFPYQGSDNCGAEHLGGRDRKSHRTMVQVVSDDLQVGSFRHVKSISSGFLAPPFERGRVVFD